MIFRTMYPRAVLSIGNFFFALCSGLLTYVLLPHLSRFMPTAYAGLVITAGSMISIVCFFLLPRLVARVGPQRLALAFALLEGIALLLLSTSPGAASAIFLAALAFLLHPFLYYQLDLLLESTVSNEGTTGRVRTLFLTGWNTGAFVAPLLVGALLAGSENYEQVFLIAAVIMLPFLALIGMRKLAVVRPVVPTNMRDTLRCMFADRDLTAVVSAHFILYLFYVWAPLYTPLFLHSVLGIPWSELGIVFSLMLLPYLFVEYPAGWLADRYLGDRKLMLLGFLVAGISFASISLFTSETPIILILAVLFITRVGTSLVESMTEGHFFRRVTEGDVNSISVFRGIWPAVDIAAPLVGSLILLFGTYREFFLITGGFILVAGCISASLINDSRWKTAGNSTCQ